MSEETYYCEKCGRNHKYTSKIGRDHVDYAGIDFDEPVSVDPNEIRVDTQVLEPPVESSFREEEVGAWAVSAPPGDVNDDNVKVLTSEPEVDPEVQQLVEVLNRQMLEAVQPLFQQYEREIAANRETINQLLQHMEEKPVQKENPLAFLKEIGLDGPTIQNLIAQLTGGGNRKHELIAQKFIEREESMLNERIDMFLDAMYGDKIIEVREPVGDAD